MSKNNFQNNNSDSLPPLVEKQLHGENQEQLIHLLKSNLKSTKKVFPQKKVYKYSKNSNYGIVPYETIVKNLTKMNSWLERAYKFLKSTNKPDLKLSYASEWVMDNFYLINRTIKLIKEDISAGFYNDLPKIDGGKQDENARIFVFAANTLVHHDLLFESETFERILTQIQKDTPFFTSELWALPIFLRLSLLEYLSNTLELLINPETKPSLLNPSRLIFEVEKESKEDSPTTNQSSAGNRVANIIHSLRTISELDWNVFFESVSPLEKLLKQDPADIYAKMDFKTRDLYRNEIEKLSRNSKYSEISLAEFLLDFSDRKSVV